ncbi:octopamine receptor 1-like [Actinia tenebrosa]|uniref:Octopamine receptor 1-like n=1 Tax=Actinia tenebrosa TaxID=6105 RepID=A0A6P8IPG1_ACTTE|nr:octopamine receptor 1-like [Actinia tenebrosa]XP_031568926.1 octopamine receptor 1-like [Actinia tenebrosa]
MNLTNPVNSYEPNVSEKTFHVFYLVIITLAIIIGNPTVLLVIRLDHRLHSPTFYFLGNLAVADLLVGVGYVPFYIVSVFNQAWVLGSTLCRAHAFVVSTSFNASIMTLCVVSVDRFLDISDPLRYYGRMTQKKTKMLIAFIWLHSIFWASCPLWNWGETLFDVTTHTCRPNFAPIETPGKVYGILLAIFGFAIPVIVTIYSYFRMFRVAEDQSKKIAKDFSMSHGASSGTEDTGKRTSPRPARDKKAHKTILIIIGAFCFCWLPYTFGTSWKILTGQTLAPYWLANLGLTLALTNSFINPIVYTIRDRRFRRGLQKALCSRRNPWENGIHSRNETHSNLALTQRVDQTLSTTSKTAVQKDSRREKSMVETR